MWFKNLQVYRFTQNFTWSATELNLELAKNAFQPCNSQQSTSYGWALPLGHHGTEYVHAANGYIMICAKRQERLLPASVINEKLAEKLQMITAKEHRKIGRNEKITLREDIVFELLPKAFTRTQLQFAYIDIHNQTLVINSSSEKRAEQLINTLRESLGSLPVIPLTAKNIPAQSMTQWLINQCPAHFSLGGECEFTDVQEKSSRISCREQNLLSTEIQSHLQSGMLVTKLGMQWHDRLSFVLNDKLGIKKLKFSDIVQEKSNTNAEDEAQQFDIDFAIMTLEISSFLKDLTKALGGELENNRQEDNLA